MNHEKLTRKRFLGNVAKVAGLSLLPAGLSGSPVAESYPVQETNEFIFKTLPYLQDLGTDGVIIMWITSNPASSWVEYGEGNPDYKAFPEAELGLLPANQYVQSVRIQGLRSATKYAYRVCSRHIVDFQPYQMQWGNTISSAVYHFKTTDPKAESVCWLVYNDIHDRPASFAHLFKLKGSYDFDFTFLNGDMFDYQTDEQQILNNLLEPLTALFASEKPFMYARGNHETRGKYARRFPDYFSNPGNKFYFSFKRGPVQFIILDTGEDKEDDHTEYNQLVAFDRYREEQASWLEQELKKSDFLNAPFRVVMMHIPVFHSGEGHGTLHCRKLFNPIFNQAGIDLMICGHTHRYGLHPADPQTHDYPLLIGGGPKEGKRTLIRARAEGKRLMLKMFADDGLEVAKLDLRSKR